MRDSTRSVEKRVAANCETKRFATTRDPDDYDHGLRQGKVFCKTVALALCPCRPLFLSPPDWAAGSGTGHKGFPPIQEAVLQPFAGIGHHRNFPRNFILRDP